MQHQPALSHVSIGTNDFPRAKAFYDAVLATLQIECVADTEDGSGYGRRFPEFWVGFPHDGAEAAPGNGVHVCFNANSVAEVQAFHAKALELGAQDEGKPGLRREYADNYYAAFVRDLDGNKIEAVFFLKEE
ncbi:MAG TPA: VOC family protein [Ramlibacter sp.]|uniref:VOC family protein n=1 Tax=Ramlibacter sp. TaxID=1917967 RepID=UPI002D80A23A|nr:VOC family protein [Ramlibacter sp.]HET8746343.1 VOC family protein [Ramlibacter sp.]